jgi:small subunit ribosomal protein S7
MEKNYIGVLVKNGNRIRAQKIFYTAMVEVSRRLHQPYYKILSDVHTLCAPIINLKYIRKSGQSYAIPGVLTDKRSISLTVRWVVASAAARKGYSMVTKLVDEIIDILNSRGAIYIKRADFHKRAVANRFLLRVSYKKNFQKSSENSEVYFKRKVIKRKR